MDLSEDQITRYARHIILSEVGGIGQNALLKARVLVVGAGGLGCPVALYLGAAGIGTLGIVDDDAVDLSNLQRQIAHGTDDIGRAKVDSLAASVEAINGDITVVRHPTRLTTQNVESLIRDYDIIVDGSDNFATRYLLNDACFFAGKTLISAALLRFEGQISTFKPHARMNEGEADRHPCYRCLFPEIPPKGLVPSCAEAGILGVLVGTVGSLQATEVIKEILGLGESLSGHLLIYNALDVSFQKFREKPNPDCALCGGHATLRDLSHHQVAA